MSSFRGAHKVSNELGEVLVTTKEVDLSATTATDHVFYPQPAVSGRSYRILEIGFTVSVAGSSAVTALIDVGTTAAPDKFIDQTDAGSSVVPASPTVGNTYSTSRGGASTWEFDSAGLDSEGVPRLEKGEVLQAGHTQQANGSKGIFFVRLAPEVVRDFDN